MLSDWPLQQKLRVYTASNANWLSRLSEDLRKECWRIDDDGNDDNDNGEEDDGSMMRVLNLVFI